MITSAVWPDNHTSIEPDFFGVGSDALGLLLNWHQIRGTTPPPSPDLIKEAIAHLIRR